MRYLNNSRQKRCFTIDPRCMDNSLRWPCATIILSTANGETLPNRPITVRGVGPGPSSGKHTWRTSPYLATSRNTSLFPSPRHSAGTDEGTSLYSSDTVSPRCRRALRARNSHRRRYQSGQKVQWALGPCRRDDHRKAPILARRYCNAMMYCNADRWDAL